MIASWSPTLAQDYCVPLTRGRWLSNEPLAASGTGPLQLQPQECGTVCRRIYETQSCHTPGSGSRWKRFSLDSPTAAHCELFFFLTAPCRNILTYLLTILWNKWSAAARISIETYDVSHRRMRVSVHWPWRPCSPTWNGDVTLYSWKKCFECCSAESPRLCACGLAAHAVAEWWSLVARSSLVLASRLNSRKSPLLSCSELWPWRQILTGYI